MASGASSVETVSLSLMRHTATSPGESSLAETDWRTVRRAFEPANQVADADYPHSAGEAIASS